MTYVKKPKAVVHVDLDGAPHIFGHHGWPYGYQDDPLFESGMSNLLSFLERNGLKATLFATADSLEIAAKRDLLMAAVTAGHEIASHSLTHPDFDRLTLEQKRHEVRESKERLESQLNCRIEGFRAPNFQIDRDTYELLAESGYRYDSSVFPDHSFAKRLEVPSILPEPYFPLLDCPVAELPLPSRGHAPFPFHPSYSLLLGKGYFKWGLRQFERTGAPLVLLFHLVDFAEPLSKTRLVNVKSRIYTLSHLSSVKKLSGCQYFIDSVADRYDIIETGELLKGPVSKASRKMVLGISTTHETGAAIYDGHECLAAISEERLDRVKFSTRYPPRLSIAAAVEAAKIDPGDITDVVISGLPPRPLFSRFVKNQMEDTLDFHGWIDYFPHFNKLLYRAFAFVRSLRYRSVLGFLQASYGIRPRLHFAPHHLCHAAAVYRTAPFDDALIVTADGVGDYTSLTISAGSKGRIKLLHLVPYPHSFGQFYTACTQVLGFRANRHEGKITGLSGFGKLNEDLYRKVKSTIRQSGADFKLDKRFYSEGIIRGFSWRMIRKGEDLFDTLQYRNYKSPLKNLLKGYSREDVAHVFQHLLEEELIEVVRPFAKQAGAKNLCLSGGIFANVKANAALFRGLDFENVYIYPHMGDGGLGPGAALEFLQSKPVPFDDVYWGPEFTQEQMEHALGAAKSSGLDYRYFDNVEEQIASLLAQDKVVARFNGRMEFGPRALCNRSILYSASDPEANNWLNKRLGRTEFMPFAPVALAEHASKLFKNIEGTEHACKFMTIILDCTDYAKDYCPAVVHVDGTARPQLVSEQINPSMHKILRHYEKLTGIPLCVNTSFNMHEEPIVCTPQDAVRAYLASGLDYLAIGSFIATMEHVLPGEHDAERDRVSEIQTAESAI